MVPHPHSTWTILNVSVRLQAVAELTDVATQELLATTAQEITGDWLGYRLRGPGTTVKGPTGLAPTQELGEALFRVPGLEGFRTLSAKAPYQEVLVVFPEKLQAGSRISWFNPLTQVAETLSMGSESGTEESVGWHLRSGDDCGAATPITDYGDTVGFLYTRQALRAAYGLFLAAFREAAEAEGWRPSGEIPHLFSAPILVVDLEGRLPVVLFLLGFSEEFRRLGFLRRLFLLVVR